MNRFAPNRRRQKQMQNAIGRCFCRGSHRHDCRHQDDPIPAKVENASAPALVRLATLASLVLAVAACSSKDPNHRPGQYGGDHHPTAAELGMPPPPVEHYEVAPGLHQAPTSSASTSH